MTLLAIAAAFYLVRFWRRLGPLLRSAAPLFFFGGTLVLFSGARKIAPLWAAAATVLIHIPTTALVDTARRGRECKWSDL